MSFTHKIDEWMKEAETRPESAVTIVKLVTRRLRELTERNEELMTENIALQNGTRVEEYQKRIAHLEYQLDLLKRRFGADDSLLAELPATSIETSTLSLLIYQTMVRFGEPGLASAMSVLYMIVIGVIALLIDLAMRRLQRTLTPWRQS